MVFIFLVLPCFHLQPIFYLLIEEYRLPGGVLRISTRSRVSIEK
jgi:hypothetical protein